MGGAGGAEAAAPGVADTSRGQQRGRDAELEFVCTLTRKLAWLGAVHRACMDVRKIWDRLNDRLTVVICAGHIELCCLSEIICG